ncbi:MAG TPA: 2-oxoglutarate dehydrogenase complex dihydrolipoyllysine-residue succinyltransferase [Polyangiaceae bacterium]|nr:2-oxoglutarate dehydrogenase complex dihydrolipoyllysine-residue succinyltransferase [Polyangiaceae bacterium]
MAIELKVPTVGESITEVQMGEWLKGEGDSVTRDEVIAKIETDKVTVDLTAPNDGVLSQIKVKKGQTANVGDVIAYIEEGAAGAAKPKAEPAKSEAPKAAPKAEPQPETKSARPTIPPQGFARVMPSARRALKERGLSPDDVEASGPGGRVLKEDVDRLKDKPAAAKAPVAQDRQEEVVAMSPFRKRIAERLVQSQQTAALLTTFNEVDMGPVMDLRKAHQEAFQEKYGIKLGFMSFFVKATIEALKLIPSVNAEIRGNDIVYKNYYDIGVAVGGGKGLAVPIIRNAERLGFAEVELAIADFGKRAKDNKLELSELQGGTFTISNGGIYGSMMSTPIVNPPQSGILGLHAIQDRPMAVKGQVVIRPMMYIALTYDHRLVDGREAVTFLKRIKQCMEEPARILLEV